MGASEDTALRLATADVEALITPPAGGRVQCLRDRRSRRELLYQRIGDPGAVDFLDASTGGWEELFPNDRAHGPHPDHGVLWRTPFRVVVRDARSATLTATIDEPRCTVSRRYTLLAAPRRGLCQETEITAGEDVDTWLWASHPMLAVRPGWCVVVGDGRVDLRADREFAGRARPGEILTRRERQRVRVVPAAGEGWQEVLYATGCTRAEVRCGSGACGTRVSWAPEALPHLWAVIVTGVAGIDLSLLLEPATRDAHDLDADVAADRPLCAGQRRCFRVEVESLDHGPPRRKHERAFRADLGHRRPSGVIR